MDDDTTLQAKLEALLFLFGEPVKFSKLAQIIGVKDGEIENAVNVLSESLKNADRGLHIVVLDDRVQITTKPALGQLMAKIAEEELD